MAQPLTNMMSGLSLGGPGQASPSAKQHHSSSSTNNAPNGNRLPPVLKKYMNPGLVRPPNTGLASSASHSHSQQAYGESARGPLLKLAGVNVPMSTHHQGGGSSGASKSSHHSSGSPGGKGHKHSLSQHTAHGLHGPAHSTSSRALASSLNPHHATHPTAAASATASAGVRKVELGRYDGGLEADEAARDVVTGDSAKLLELDSSAAG